VLDGDRFVVVPGFAIKAIDTTGAGDHFRAGFAHGLIQGWPIAEVLRFANATAAVSCTRRGAVASAASLADVEEMQRSHGTPWST
jgi:sugar/nucleoside kinase (ribokinase family)